MKFFLALSNNWSYNTITKFLSMCDSSYYTLFLPTILFAGLFHSFFVSEMIPTLQGRVSIFYRSELLSTKISREKQVPTYVGAIQKIHRQEAVLRPDDFIYIRHETSCYHVPPHPSTAPLNATRPCNRTSAPDPLGRGQYVLGRNTPLLCVVTVNTTLSVGGQPPPPRKPTRLVGIIVACDRFAMLLR